MKKRLIPWIGYPGSTLQNTYAEDLEHGYLVWDVDTKARRHSVEFSQLPNPKPFVTIDWAGSVDATFELATSWPNNSRFRIRSAYTLPSADAAALSVRLRKEKNASEVVFKSDDEESTKKFASASLGVDVRSLDAMERMLREYYSEETFDDRTWEQMLATLGSVHPKVTCDDEINRGTFWTIKQLEFDSLYGYGPDNTVNLEDKSGIVGIFGPNRIGKSSIVGSITYSLFNSSDRDVGKNAHVVNFNKKTGSARTIISVAGSDYEIKRSTTKVISRGLLTANTSLSVKQLDGDMVDLTGEQRSDTEKNLRKLIGTYEDFAFTGGQVQDDVGRFLKEGPTQRKAILSRFLGIDVFEKLFALLNSELNDVKGKLKNLPSQESLLASAKLIEEEQVTTRDSMVELESSKVKIDASRSEAYSEVQRLTPIVEIRQKVVEKNHLIEQSMRVVQECVRDLADLNESLKLRETELAVAQSLLNTCMSWDEMDSRRKGIHDAKLALERLRSSVDAKSKEVERSKKIALKLLDVPCGDQYPSCVYIKDAHVEKGRVDELQKELSQLVEQHSAATEALVQLGEADLEAAKKLRNEREQAVEACESAIRKEKLKQQALQQRHDKAKSDAAKYTTISLDDSDVEQQLALASNAYKQLTQELNTIEAQLKAQASNLGKFEANLSKVRDDLESRASMEQETRTRELLVNAFSRRGIPNIILGKLLPTLNAEMDKVLDGVVNFRVWLQADDDTNALEVMLDDGQPRPLELGSGMERFVGCLALRVALSNLTTLPKPDFMIIDEGFGSLDDVNAVACVSLLRSVARGFRFVLVISHVDIIKDAVDTIIDVEKTSDGARVQA
jgi:DNA repair exonuclease SbcCD ATPase subunit